MQRSRIKISSAAAASSSSGSAQMAALPKDLFTHPMTRILVTWKQSTESLSW
ncbi:MAG TPA: hypothetical protein VFR94_04530 [Nitrososphaeraceae archaeon]|nr:hypothetical protein [Nitrososphaeraceae archaeon]